MGDLKPCPFCGSEDIEDWGESTWSRPVKWMYCTCCNAHGPRVIMGRDEDYDVWLQRVRAAWNLRATPPEVTALVEALRPLAEMACRYDPEDDDGHLECWSGLAVPKIKHIRAARAALAKWEAAQ